MTPKRNVKNSERRIKTRFRAPGLNILLHRKGMLGLRKTPLKAQCVDINRYGMAIITALDVTPGSEILVDFRGKYISESSVKARVMSVRPFGAGYRLGLQFSYCMAHDSYCRAVDNALSRIEALYRGRKLHSIG